MQHSHIFGLLVIADADSETYGEEGIPALLCPWQTKTDLRAIRRWNMEKNVSLHQLQKKIHYEFNDFGLLTRAMTHTSYANEHRKQKVQHNERLEFLGDAVLELVSSEFLYKKYPDRTEGELTKLRASMVCEPTLAMCAREWHLGSFLRLGKGEELNGGRNRDSITSDAVEALIGAIYLDGGFASAKEFVEEFILKDIENKKLFYDSKTILQELVQGKETGDPEYRLVKEEGPDHDKCFYVELVLNGTAFTKGKGHTKKAAEQEAAYLAIRKLQKQ